MTTTLDGSDLPSRALLPFLDRDKRHHMKPETEADLEPARAQAMRA